MTSHRLLDVASVDDLSQVAVDLLSLGIPGLGCDDMARRPCFTVVAHMTHEDGEHGDGTRGEGLIVDPGIHPVKSVEGHSALSMA
jgi:hypothetical protein